MYVPRDRIQRAVVPLTSPPRGWPATPRRMRRRHRDPHGDRERASPSASPTRCQSVGRQRRRRAFRTERGVRRASRREPRCRCSGTRRHLPGPSPPPGCTPGRIPGSRRSPRPPAIHRSSATLGSRPSSRCPPPRPGPSAPGSGRSDCKHRSVCSQAFHAGITMVATGRLAPDPPAIGVALDAFAIGCTWRIAGTTSHGATELRGVGEGRARGVSNRRSKRGGRALSCRCC